ncbi:MAG TPA: methylated-DNA--[protein]-cysteine S-methyltransferase [Acidimicrobiia bacterium]
MNIEQRLSSLLGDRAPDSISEATALGTGLADGYDFYDSPVGKVVVAFNPAGVSAVTLAEEDYATYFGQRFARRLIRAQAPKNWAHLIPQRIEAGSPGQLPVDLRSVTAFQSQVLLEAAAIPRGEVRPYGWLARQVGKPGAARAVGSTMARNPVPLIIPCHRVVRSDGHIGAYSLGGPHQKWELLTHEGAEPGRLEDLASHNVRVQGDTSTGVYCFPTCHVIRASQSGNVVDFASVEKAVEAGGSPCRMCQPS